MEWIDAGRGTAVLLVALYHAGSWLDLAGYSVDMWITVSAVIASLRLPVFFVLSGLFARKWVLSRWGELWSGKVSLLVWVYLLWSVVATFAFMLGMSMQEESGSYFYQVLPLLKVAYAPRFELWFVWALALFFLVGRLARSVPAVLQLVVTGGVSMVVMSMDVVNAGPAGAAKYAFFFFAGLHLRSTILAFASVRSPWVIGLTILAWLGCALTGTLAGLFDSVPGMVFVTSCVGVLAGVCFARALARLAVLRHVGAHTLPIYLTHTPVILACSWALHFVDPAIKTNHAVLVLPPLLVLLSAYTALRFSDWTVRRAVLQYLFLAPPWFASLDRWLPRSQSTRAGQR